MRDRVPLAVLARVALEVPLQEEPLRKALRAAASHHAGGRVVINMEI